MVSDLKAAWTTKGNTKALNSGCQERKYCIMAMEKKEDITNQVQKGATVLQSSL